MVDSLDNVYYYLNDHLGSAGVLITSTGTVRDKYKYKPFGDNNGSSIINGQSYRYTGKPLDEELDLDWYYYGARYYGPEIGRFLAVDPLNSKYPSLSPYVYAGNNPLKYRDPNGQWKEEVHNMILEESSEGLLNDKEIAVLKAASVKVDDYQGVEHSFMHAMTGEDPTTGSRQTREQAMAMTLDFVMTMTDKFVQTGNFGYLGAALHPLMDATSPSHEGSQVWGGLLSDPLGAIAHGIGERNSQYAGERRQQAVGLTGAWIRMALERRKKAQSSSPRYKKIEFKEVDRDSPINEESLLERDGYR